MRADFLTKSPQQKLSDIGPKGSKKVKNCTKLVHFFTRDGRLRSKWTLFSLFGHYFKNTHTRHYVPLTTFSQNTGVTGIYTSSYIELESNNFFTHFTALQYIYCSYVLSREPLSFTNLLSLTLLRVNLVGPVTQALDEGIVSVLTNLVHLDLQNSYFNGITEGALLNLNKLTYLDLSDNQLTYFEDGALRDLSSLERLYLNDNNIRIVPDNAFESLTNLTSLDLSNNPGFPLNALIQAKSVRHLYLQNNGYSTLEPYVFQQMDSLEYLFLSDPFVCDCKLQWTSLVGQYGLSIRSSGCLEPLDFFSRYITNISLYTNCSQTESFQCFHRFVTCLGNQLCHSTENSYFCGCPRGYALHGSGQCEDVDECDETTDCQHTCQNTEGSFYCTCDEGYELSSDGYSCDDIDECQELNGGCESGCRNTVGSYECYCYYSHKLTNNTHCDNDIQYIVIQGIETEDYQFVCYGDYNLTITNFTCENIPPTSVTTTTTIPSVCPVGYVQRYSGECVDEDECDFYTNCQHSCVNTEGSFHCDCNEGYELVSDGYSCNENQSVAVTSEQFLTSTIIIVTLLIFIILLQTVVIILILLYYIRMRKTVRKSNIHHNMNQAQFQATVEIPLVELIDKRPNIAPDMIIENSVTIGDNPTYEVIK